MTLISAHSGLCRKLVTLTECSTLLQVRHVDKLRRHDSFISKTQIAKKIDRWSRRRDLNPRPTDYKSVALPTELRRPGLQLRHTSSMEFQSEAITQSGSVLF